MYIYPVSEIARYLRDSLEADGLLSDLWVSGEASGVTVSQAGHCYFTLKDDVAQVRCVALQSRQGRYGPGRGPIIVPKNGEAIIVHGKVSFYEARGDLQCLVDLVQPEGVGRLHLEQQRLMAKLEAEGLFETSRKRRLPPYPKRIALVTSPVGAVLHDLTTIIGRRYPCVELVVAPVQVQGDAAPGSIIAALSACNSLDLDLVILARGGGSAEDLAPFNNEYVARAVYACRAPIIAAVGHETDTTIVDYVADLRAPTPSAAAELAVPDRTELLGRLAGARAALNRGIRSRVGEERSLLNETRSAMARALPDRQRLGQRVDSFRHRLELRLDGILTMANERLASRRARLTTLDPRQVLTRGYAIVQRERDGAVVSHVAEAPAGEGLAVTVQDGTFGAEGRG